MPFEITFYLGGKEIIKKVFAIPAPGTYIEFADGVEAEVESVGLVENSSGVLVPYIHLEEL